MNWKRPNDAALLAQDADAALAWASWVSDAGLWVAGHVTRWRCTDGRAAWLWLTADDSLMCCAVAPWDSVWTVDHVESGAFFGAVAPADWHTKARLGVASRDWTTANRTQPIVWDGAIWAVAQMPDKKTVHLCKVASVQGGNLHSVQTVEGGPPVLVAQHAARRWWPLTKYEGGCEALWEAGLTEHKAYMWLALRAKRAGATPAHAKPVAPARGAVVPLSAVEVAQNADFRRRMDAKRIELGLPAFTDAEWQAFRSA